MRELEALQKAHFSCWVGVYQAIQGKQKHSWLLLLAVSAQNCSSGTRSHMWVVTKEVRKAISDHSLVLVAWTHGSCLPREDMRLGKLKKEWNMSMGQESFLDFSSSGFSHKGSFDQKETVEWCAMPSFNGLSTWLPAFVSSLCLYSIQCLFNVKKILHKAKTIMISPYSLRALINYAYTVPCSLKPELSWSIRSTLH